MSPCVKYDRDTLLDIGHLSTSLSAPVLDYSIECVLCSSTSNLVSDSSINPSIYKQRKRKRGKRGGVLVRYKKRTFRAPLPGILLSNVQSANNKRDEFLNALKYKQDFKDCAIVCFTETWLDESTPDVAICPEGYTVFRADRSPDLSGKKRGGGLCVLINQRWCTDSTEITALCSPDLELISIVCKPFYSPREFASTVVVAVYIPPGPSANKQRAAREIADHVSEVESKYPDSFVTVIGDMNRCSLKKVLPKFYQQVTCTTRKDATLDECYCKIKDAYSSLKRAPFGKSDHATLILVPKYKQRLKQSKPQIKKVRRFPPSALDTLRAEFDCTLWSTFEDSCTDIDEYTDVVTSYVAFCEDKNAVEKTIKVYPNDKPWYTPQLAELRQKKTEAYVSGDETVYKKAKYALSKGIDREKIRYKKKIEEKFESGDARSVWQGLQTMTDYKKKSPPVSADPDLAEKLNIFYARFDPNCKATLPTFYQLNPNPTTHVPLPSMSSSVAVAADGGGAGRLTPVPPPSLSSSVAVAADGGGADRLTFTPVPPPSLSSSVAVAADGGNAGRLTPVPPPSPVPPATITQPPNPIPDPTSLPVPPPPPASMPLPPPSSQSASFSIQISDVENLFQRQNCRKAAGPDGVSPATLRHCAQQLAPVFANIFNSSLEQCHVPKCFKMSKIIPIPKGTKISCLNDYRPVALTSVIMKVFERLVLRQLKTQTDALLDPCQFAYRANRSVDDAVALGLHAVLTHLDKPKSYVRMLFVDYSSAFNTIIPHKLHTKLLQLGVDPSLCDWILSFLSDRPQVVRAGEHESSSLTLNVGTPQGCVLSPSLYSLFTNDCVSNEDSVKVIKFADDTTLEGLIEDNDESMYRDEVRRLEQWCGDNNLELNVEKTKEVVIDMRKNKSTHEPLMINNQEVELIDSFKFLGTTISSSLSWEEHCAITHRKAQQRLHFLRQLKKFRAQQAILLQFYRATVESMLTFSISVWYGNASAEDRLRLQKVIHAAEKIIGCELPSLEALYRQRTTRRARKIVSDASHPSNHLFSPLPSGRRFRSIRARTERLRRSFVPSAIRLLNNLE